MSKNDDSEKNTDQMKSDRKKRVVKKVIIKRAATQKLPPKLAEQLAKSKKDGKRISLQDIKEEISEDEKRKKVQRRVPGRIRTKKSTTKKLSRETAEAVAKRKKGLTKATTKKLSREAAKKVMAKAKDTEEGKKSIGVITKTPSAKPIAKPKPAPLPVVTSPLPENWKNRKIEWYKKIENLERARKPLPIPALLQNKRKNNSYKIIEIVQKDRFGGVYKATDEKDKKKTVRAIKEIQFKSPPNSSPSLIKDVMNRLSRMASFLEDANHKYLADIKDYIPYIENDTTGCFFVVMEFIEGKTLGNLIRDYKDHNKPLPGELILNVAKSLCEVMHYLHNRKPFPISFGDIKPSNIMLQEDKTIKLINYGLDKAFESDLDEKEGYRGTVGYSSPEQSGVDFTNTKADIFAFGATLYYLITGVNPEKNPYEFKRFRELKPGISNTMEDLIFKCLSLEAAKRPTIDKLKEEIEKATLDDLDTAKEPKVTHKLSLTDIEEPSLSPREREERKKDTIELQEEHVKSIIQEPEKVTKSVIKLPEEIAKEEKAEEVKEEEVKVEEA